MFGRFGILPFIKLYLSLAKVLVLSTWERLQKAARLIATLSPKYIIAQSSSPYGQKTVSMFAHYTAIDGRHTPGTFSNKPQSYYLLIVTDPLINRESVMEATLKKIPVIAFCNTDSPSRLVGTCIPANNKRNTQHCLPFLAFSSYDWHLSWSPSPRSEMGCHAGSVSEHRTRRSTARRRQRAKHLPVSAAPIVGDLQTQSSNNINVGKASTSLSRKTIEEGTTCKPNKRLENVKLQLAKLENRVELIHGIERGDFKLPWHPDVIVPKLEERGFQKIYPTESATEESYDYLCLETTLDMISFPEKLDFQIKILKNLISILEEDQRDLLDLQNHQLCSAGLTEQSLFGE